MRREWVWGLIDYEEKRRREEKEREWEEWVVIMSRRERIFEEWEGIEKRKEGKKREREGMLAEDGVEEEKERGKEEERRRGKQERSERRERMAIHKEWLMCVREYERWERVRWELGRLEEDEREVVRGWERVVEGWERREREWDELWGRG